MEEQPTVPQPSAAPVKKTSRTRSTKATSHPKYSEMINFAVKALKQRSGSSRQAITKYVKTNYEVGDKASKIISRNLKSMIESKDLVLASGTGASGRFKIAKTTTTPRVSAGVSAKKRAAAKKKRGSPKKKRPAARKSPKKKRRSPIKKRTARKSPKKVVRKSAKKSLKKQPKKKGRK